MKKLGVFLFLVTISQMVSSTARADDSHADAEKHWFYMVQTKSTDPAREAEFNAWYDDIDIPDVPAVPGFMRARRGLGQKVPEFPAVDLQDDEGKYVALYDIETDDIDKSIIDLYVAARKMGALGRLTDLLKVVEASYYRRLAPTYEVPNTKPTGKNKYIYIQKILCCRDKVTKAEFRDWYDNTYISDIREAKGLIRVNLYELYRVMTVLSVGPEEIPHLLAVYEIEVESAKQAIEDINKATDQINEADRMSELYVQGEAAVYLEMSDVRSEAAGRETADMVFRNGQVYTVNESQPWAQAVAVKNGIIVAVGDENSVASYIGTQTQVIDLGGKFVMPGIHDAHLHMQLVVDLQFNLRMDAYQPWDAIVKAITEYAQAHPDRIWIYGASLPWLSEIIGDFTEVPAHKSVLDQIVTDRPVAISDIGGHAMLVNSKALDMAGITDDTPNPVGGTIERDANGEATGVLRELAIHVVKESMDGLSVEQYKSGLPQVIGQLNAVGITSVNEVWAHSETVKALKLLDDANTLNLRITAAITHPADFVTPPAKENARKMIEDRDQYRGKRIKPDYVKFLLDGAVNKTAAMVDAYEGTDYHGHTRDPVDVVLAEVSRLHALGVGSVIHAVGDRAIRIALNAIEQAIATHGANDVRHVIAHTVFVNPEDHDRFAKLGVIADFSPYFWWPNEVIDSYRSDVGEHRLAWVWAIKDMVDRGVTVTAGSDWPVLYSPNPFPAIEAMVTRKDPGGGRPEESFNTEQAITLEQALKIFTLGDAFELHQEDVAGSIEVGKYADMVVLDRNLFNIPIADVSESIVLQTWLEGKLVFDRASGG